jgi:phosphoribosylanthranilate isomerase
MKVKICGITTLADALAAIDAGAELLGFNCYPQSPRYIAPQACTQIVSAITDYVLRIANPTKRKTHSVILIGVFVNAPAAEITATLDACGLHLAQLHGDEPPEMLAALGKRAFKALRPVDADALANALRNYPPRSDAPTYLIDAYHPTMYGGAGQIGNWSLATMLAEQSPVLLAGGLTPANVATAVAQVMPWGVDVASGVESSPGVKDHAKMRAFIQNAKKANQQKSKGIHHESNI